MRMIGYSTIAMEYIPRIRTGARIGRWWKTQALITQMDASTAHISRVPTRCAQHSSAEWCRPTRITITPAKHGPSVREAKRKPSASSKAPAANMISSEEE